MIESYLLVMEPFPRLVAILLFIAFVLIMTGMVIGGIRDIVLALFHGYPDMTFPIPMKKPKPTPVCNHEDNIQKLCLRGPSGCGTKEDCRKAVEDGDY